MLWVAGERENPRIEGTKDGSHARRLARAGLGQGYIDAIREELQRAQRWGWQIDHTGEVLLDRGEGRDPHLRDGLVIVGARCVVRVKDFGEEEACVEAPLLDGGRDPAGDRDETRELKVGVERGEHFVKG